MRKFSKQNRGITLIALIITIIVLLILAGISIATLAGDNGVLTKASDAKILNEIGATKDEINLKAAEAMSDYYDSVYGNTISSPQYSNTELAKSIMTKIAKDFADNNKTGTAKDYANYTIAVNGEGVGATITIQSKVKTYLKTVGTMQDDGKIIWDDEFKKKVEITVSGLTVKNGSTEVVDGSKSAALNTPLTINFEASITEGSITSISPTVPYTTNGTETSKTFTIAGTGGVTKEYTVNLKGYYNIPDLKVGDFVKYELSAIDNSKVTTLNNDVNTYSGQSSTQTISRAGTITENGKEYLLCRVLEMDSNKNPTKLISANGINSLKLKGANGYNNAVYLINEMCETLYSGNQGTTTSLTIEDLENNYFDSTALTTAKGSNYGKKFRYTGDYSKYPLLAAKEKRMGINTETETVDGNTYNKLNISNTALDLSEQKRSDLESGGGTETDATNGITVTNTYYYIDQGESNYKNATLNNIIHNSPTASSDTAEVASYLMASRCVYADSDICSFYVRHVSSNYVNYVRLSVSNGDWSLISRAVRPVITLNSGIQAEYSARYNDTYNTWTIN